MKRIFFVLCFLIIYLSDYAQKNYNIIYQISNRNNSLGEYLPIIKLRLLIKDSISYEYPFDEKDDGKEPYGKKFHLHSTFKNISSGLCLYQSQPIYNPRYLITDTIKKIEWEMVNEQKIILGYPCKKATCTFHNALCTAWYSNDIPVSFGPDFSWGLPGLILELEIPKFGQLITATKIGIGNVEIVQPDVGKKITPEKLQKIISKINK